MTPTHRWRWAWPRAVTASWTRRVAQADRPVPPPDQSGAQDRASEGGEATPSTAKTADGKAIKTKTYTFGAMDVEGKLKTPQLLYFLNRVKLELDMSAPDKRSFM